MTEADAQKITSCLSTPRMTTYHQVVAHKPQHEQTLAALALYRWNVEVSAAFMAPIHLCEVVIRNAASDALTAVYGPRWVWDPSFTGALPDPPRPVYSPKRDLIQVRQHHATVGKVIPELKFVFWENLFTRRHDGRLWNRHLLTVLPNLDASQPTNVLRNTVRAEIETVRHIRNRVAQRTSACSWRWPIHSGRAKIFSSPCLNHRRGKKQCSNWCTQLRMLNTRRTHQHWSRPAVSPDDLAASRSPPACTTDNASRAMTAPPKSSLPNPGDSFWHPSEP